MSLPILLPIGTEQSLLARLVFRNGSDEVGDVEEVRVVEIVRYAVPAPGAAAHAQRKIEPIVETAAVAEGVGPTSEPR